MYVQRLTTRSDASRPLAPAAIAAQAYSAWSGPGRATDTSGGSAAAVSVVTVATAGPAGRSGASVTASTASDGGHSGHSGPGLLARRLSGERPVTAVTAGAVPVTAGAEVTAPGHGGHGAGHGATRGFHGAGHSDHGDGERPAGPVSAAASAAGAAAFTRVGGLDKINRGEEDSRACNEILVPAINAKFVAPLHGHEQAFWASCPIWLAILSPSLDRLQALTERIQQVIQVTSGHCRVRDATRIIHLVCHFQARAQGWRLATFCLRPALFNVRAAAMLHVAAHSELQARPTARTSDSKRQGPGGRCPFQRSRPGAARF